MDLLDVRVVAGLGQHARDDATLPRDPQAVLGAQALDVPLTCFVTLKCCQSGAEGIGPG